MHLFLVLLLAAPAPVSPTTEARASSLALAQAQQAPANSTSVPVQARPNTIVLNADVIAGSRVFVPSARIVRMLGPRLIAVADARAFPEPIISREREELLLLLPAGADLKKGEVISAVGQVRTVSAMRRDNAAPRDELRKILDSKRYRRALMLVAESAQTLDGFNLR
jgi:hypothetical protein